MPNPVLAKRLKMARCGADLSREELAAAISKRLGHRVSGELLRRIEVGERDVEFGMIVAVSEITGESITWLTEGAVAIPGYRKSFGGGALAGHILKPAAFEPLAAGF